MFKTNFLSKYKNETWQNNRFKASLYTHTKIFPWSFFLILICLIWKIYELPLTFLKAILSVHPFIWKWDFSHTQIESIFIWNYGRTLGLTLIKRLRSIQIGLWFSVLVYLVFSNCLSGCVLRVFILLMISFSCISTNKTSPNIATLYIDRHVHYLWYSSNLPNPVL